MTEGTFAWWCLRRGPRIALGLLCVGLLVSAAFHPGRGVESMDVRTYAQMIRGVVDHGLPYWDNGPLDRFTALVVPWGVAAQGHVWGVYGPLYPYLAAPAFRVGSLELVSEFTFALLCPLAVATFLLARRFVRSEWYAVFASALVVFSTPLLAKAVEITAYPLTTVLAALATNLSLRSIERVGRERRASLLAGVAWGGCCAAHALGFPMTVAAFAAMASAPGRPDAGARLPLAARRLVFAMAGFALVIVPMALLNHLRFGSYNPVSYGPIPWTGDVNPALLKQNVGDELRYAAPWFIFGGAMLAALALARNRRGFRFAIGAIGVALALLVEPLRTRGLRVAVVAFGNVVDLTAIDMGRPYSHASDGIGQLFAGHVVKSTLQCTPILLLAPLALMRARGARRWRVALLLAPSAGLFAALVLRANLPYVDAIGWPWMYIRYTFPALPMLVVASVVVIEELRPRWGDGVVALAVATVLAVGLYVTQDERPLLTRLTLLVLPVGVAALAFVAVARARGLDGSASRLTRMLTAVAVGTGLAVGVGHDYPSNESVQTSCDDLVDRFARVVPERFAFFGVLGEFDVLLSLAATHDVQYADLLRVPEFGAIRPLLDYWRSERRPIYFLSMSDPPRPWADVVYQPVAGVAHVYLVEFREPPTAMR